MQTADYIQAAVEHANFGALEDDTVYAEIPGLDGVWASADTREAATEELREVLEDWILLRVSKGLSIPDMDGHTIEVPRRESLKALAQEQGVPPADFDKLSGEFWPGDEDPEDFVTALRRWRSDHPGRTGHGVRHPA